MSTPELRAMLSSFGAGTIAIDDLRRGLPDGVDIDDVDDVLFTQVALRAIGSVAEFDHGDFDESTLRARINELVKSTEQPPAVATTSSVTTSLASFAVGTRSSAATA